MVGVPCCVVEDDAVISEEIGTNEDVEDTTVGFGTCLGMVSNADDGCNAVLFKVIFCGRMGRLD